MTAFANSCDPYNVRSVKLAEATMVRLFLPGLGGTAAEEETEQHKNAPEVSSEASLKAKRKMAQLERLNRLSEDRGSAVVVLEELLVVADEESTSEGERDGQGDESTTTEKSGRASSANNLQQPKRPMSAKLPPKHYIPVWERPLPHGPPVEKAACPPRVLAALQPKVMDLAGSIFRTTFSHPWPKPVISGTMRHVSISTTSTIPASSISPQSSAPKRASDTHIPLRARIRSAIEGGHQQATQNPAAPLFQPSSVNHLLRPRSSSTTSVSAHGSPSIDNNMASTFNSKFIHHSRARVQYERRKHEDVRQLQALNLNELDISTGTKQHSRIYWGPPLPQ